MLLIYNLYKDGILIIIMDILPICADDFLFSFKNTLIVKNFFKKVFF